METFKFSCLCSITRISIFFFTQYKLVKIHSCLYILRKGPSYLGVPDIQSLKTSGQEHECCLIIFSGWGFGKTLLGKDRKEIVLQKWLLREHKSKAWKLTEGGEKFKVKSIILVKLYFILINVYCCAALCLLKLLHQNQCVRFNVLR